MDGKREHLNKEATVAAVTPNTTNLHEAYKEDDKMSTDPRQGKTRLEKFKDVCHRWFHIEDDSYIDVIFGVVFANRLDVPPLWLYLVGPSGSGKSILQSLDGHDAIYALTSLTPRTLISGKELQQGEADPSLMPKLDGKVMVIKDFTVILQARHDSVKEILGQLRDAYDGESRSAFGTGKDTKYKSKFGIIAAVTSAIYRYVRKISALGERFLMFRMPQASEEEVKARTAAAAKSVAMSQQEEELKKAAHHVLDLEPPKPTISDGLRGKIEDIALFVAVARTSVHRDSTTREIDSIPEPELPTRMVKQLVSLAKGIAMARERDTVSEDEVAIVSMLALHGVRPERLELIKTLTNCYPGGPNLGSVSRSMRISMSTVNRWTDDLHALRIVDKPGTSGAIPSGVKMSKKYYEMIKDIDL